MSIGKAPDHKLLKGLVTIEAFLGQIIFYLFLWFWDDYMALVLSSILGGIALFVYIISHLVELVDRSRVPRVYYRLMLFSFIAPLISGVLGVFLRNGFSWM